MHRMAFLVALALASPAVAHIKLSAPDDSVVTDVDGNPQKQGPCPAGTATGKVTQVNAGEKLKVRWTETVSHKGHFRISIASDRSALITPTPVVNNNDCISAPIQSTPSAPVIMDGLFVHASGAPKPYEQEITLPDVACDNCTLQVMQFMAEHTPPCFYFHCANLKIVKKTVPDAGVDAGQPVDSGTPADAGQDAGTDAGMALDAGADGGMTSNPPDDLSGCGCGGGPAQAGLPALLILVAALLRRRPGRTASGR